MNYSTLFSLIVDDMNVFKDKNWANYSTVSPEFQHGLEEFLSQAFDLLREYIVHVSLAPICLSIINKRLDVIFVISYSIFTNMCLG